MSFSCSRCCRDFFKICKILFDVDICDECIKLKKSCDVFIFESTCEFCLSCSCDFLRFSQENVLKMRRSNFMSKLRILLSNILSRIKKFNRYILVKRKFVMICSLASSIFVVCWANNVVLFNVSKLLKRRKTILSCKSNECFLVLTRSMILLSFILSKCMSQSLKRLSLSQYRWWVSRKWTNFFENSTFSCSWNFLIFKRMFNEKFLQSFDFDFVCDDLSFWKSV